LKVQAIEAGVFFVNSLAWRFSAFGEFVSCMVCVQYPFLQGVTKRDQFALCLMLQIQSI
jgi:hypothetical protein